MFEIKDLFYKWLPVYIKLPVLFILLFTILTANGVFLGNTTDMYSSLGVYTESFTMAYNALYIGMGLGLIFHVRLKMRFTNKTLLLTGLSAMLILNGICALTSEPAIIIACCLLLGFLKICALIETYIIWLIVWSKKGERSRSYPFIYFTALAGLYLVTWLTTHLAYLYNWRLAYGVIIILLLVSLLLTLLFVENHGLNRKFPLYQLDLTGLLLLGTGMMFLNYLIVYGKVENWFYSVRITASLIAAIMALLLFMIRQLKIKRPFYNLALYKDPNFRTGLLYFLLLGVFIPSTFQSAFAVNILHFEMVRNAELNLYLIPGIFAGALFCYWYYAKGFNTDLIIIIGFSAMVAYHMFMYSYFVSDLNMNAFWLPSLVKGFGMGVLYISIGLYTSATLNMSSVLTASGSSILFRSFLGSGFFSALYTYLLYVQRIKHFNRLVELAEVSTFQPTGTSGPADQFRYLQGQSILAASKELTGYIIIAGLLLVLLLIVRLVVKRISVIPGLTHQRVAPQT